MTPPQRRIRVVVWLDAGSLERLETIVRHRRGPRSRSAVVREAVGWLLAREAAWLLRQQAAEDGRRRREADLQLALAIPRQQRDELDVQAAIAAALRLVADRAREDA